MNGIEDSSFTDENSQEETLIDQQNQLYTQYTLSSVYY